MPRAQKNSVIAFEAAEKFLSTLRRSRIEARCEVTVPDLEALWDKYGPGSIPFGAILRELAAAGAVARLIRSQGVRTRVWCINCRHASLERYTRGRNRKESNSACASEKDSEDDAEENAEEDTEEDTDQSDVPPTSYSRQAYSKL